jgi:two-component system, LytTR family, response regulator
MMLHAIIIDDEKDGVNTLKLLIEKFVPELKVVASSTNAIEGIDLINNYRPDIVFLDINMPILNGFQLLENLSFKTFHLVFTTAHSEYGLKALKKGAVDYLLKPVDIDDIKTTVARIKSKNTQEQVNFESMLRYMEEKIIFERFKVPLPAKNTIEYVYPNEIIYIEADMHHSKVKLINHEFVVVFKPIKDYEALLCKDEDKFIRIHNSFIINTNHIMRYLKEGGGYAVMKDSKSIPISKQKKLALLKAINLLGEN